MTEIGLVNKEHACYLFEAKSIQQYLFSTNRLREIVGGSEMIENMTGSDGLLDKLIMELKIREKLQFSRRGGGAFYVFSDPKTIEKLQNAWSLLFQVTMPNMSFNHASSSAESYFDAFEEAQKELLASRNRIMARMPQATPFTLRFNRTGEPAEAFNKTKNRTEAIDIATDTKLAYAHGLGLIKRFYKESEKKNWPIYLTPEPDEEKSNFPFIDDTQLVALIHADGNGFGQLLMSLKEHVKTNAQSQNAFIDLFADVSKAISTATEIAAQIAVDTVLEPNKKGDLFPARPIVLGGDDLTIIVRADIAIAFTQSFLCAFESESENQLRTLKSKYELSEIPTKLTACAGIVFAKSTHPFYMMHDLSEALCSAAKEQSKSKLKLNETVPSSLVFHGITTSLVDDYSNIVANELTAGGKVATLGAYTTSKEENHLPHIDDLYHLLNCFEDEKNSSSAFREIQELLSANELEAGARYKRWLEIIERQESTFKQNYLSIMNTLISRKDDESGSQILPNAEDFSSFNEWPLADLLSLQKIKTKSLSQISEMEAENV